MKKSLNTRRVANTQRDRKIIAEIYYKSLAYQPMQMKPVHFATSFLLALCRKYRKLELLNKASCPKATEKKADDEYVAENLFQFLKDNNESVLGTQIELQDFKLLRQHLNNAYNNDGAALGPSFPPYSTFGCDNTMPSLEYLSNKSKNHGNSGAFVWLALNSSNSGKKFLSLAKSIAENADSPAAKLGKPLIVEGTEDYEHDPSCLCGNPSMEFLLSASNLMIPQTESLNRLATHLEKHPTAFALRNLLLGLGSWLLLYQIRRIVNCEKTVFFCDFSGDTKSRLRAKSAACYSRQLGLFGRSLHLWIENDPSVLNSDEREVFTKLGERVVQDLEEHFRDFSVRIGWAQPRTGTSVKYFRPQPDTMRVLLMSVLEPDEVCTMDEIADRLRKHWNLVFGRARPRPRRVRRSESRWRRACGRRPRPPDRRSWP